MRDRRRHKMFVTKNSEYHFRDSECVGVRDRNTGRWVWKHKALRALLTGYLDKERRVWSQPGRGRRLHLITPEGWLVTSPLTDMGRPSKADIWSYVSLQTAGEIDK